MCSSGKSSKFAIPYFKASQRDSNKPFGIQAGDLELFSMALEEYPRIAIAPERRSRLDSQRCSRWVVYGKQCGGSHPSTLLDVIRRAGRKSSFRYLTDD